MVEFAMLSVIFIMVLFVIILISKPECPECGSRMDDVGVGVQDGHIIYKCRKCGEEWI